MSNKNIFYRPPSDFFRPMLRETDAKIIAPELYIQDWYYELLGLKESTEGQYGSPLSEAEDYYSLFVHYGRFLRVLPEFLDQEVRQLMNWAQGIFERLGQDEFQKALEIFQPVQWLDDANNVSDAWKNDQMDEAESRLHALVLFTDYDDARLCIEMAWRKLGNEPFIEKYSNAIIPCDQWVEDDEYLVDLASLWYQTNACMLDEENKIEHAMTFDHFIGQLDKLEANWVYMNEPIAQINPLGTLCEPIASTFPKYLHKSLAERMGITIAAENNDQNKLEELKTITWLHPERNDEAILAWNTPITKDSEYTLVVAAQGFKVGTTVSKYVARKVRLGETLEGTLDDNGSVVFQYSEIVELGKNHSRLDLHVEHSDGEMLQWNEDEDENADEH